MKILLDTHAWLWFVLGDLQLSDKARALISDPTNEKLISPASYWELAIKISIGKYLLTEPYADFMKRAIIGNGLIILPIAPVHTSVLTSLPFHHKDPFDRLLIAQSIAEGIPIVSADAVFDTYPVVRLW
ncbi:MAG: type II toxin-antitoxin system VapC family toxin [Acidobacteria bacterium]|nr:type II toxin-antitoxin system VapC family toxin [Acidobacteriota bacterium]